MGGDVFPRLARGIVAQAMSEPDHPAERTLCAADIAEGDGVGGEELEHLYRIGARPFAKRPRLVPADRTRGREADQREPARQAHVRFRTVRVEAEAALRPVGQSGLDPAAHESPIDLVEDFGEGWRGKPRNQAAARRKTAV